MKQTNEQKAIEIYYKNPSLTNADIARLLGVNQSSISDYLKFVPGYKSAGNKKKGRR